MAEPTWLEPTEAAFGLNRFVSLPEVTRDLARAVCRSLTDRGFATYHRGLWSEDGEPAGAGYGITAEGMKYLRELQEGHP